MDAISVSCEAVTAGHRCTVILGDDPRATTHEVTVSEATLDRLAPSSAAAGSAQARVEGLVRASFAFLLEREPRGSILRTFDLPVIERYFPGYEREIGARVPRVATHLQDDAPDAEPA